MTITNVTPTPAVQSTCPDCQGHGEFVTGPYSRPCGECHGEGVRVVTAKCDACGDTYPAGSGTLFRFWSGKADDLLCPGCTAEALTDPENWARVGDEPTPPAPVPTATIIAEASPADNAAGRYGAAAKSSGPGGFDRAMLAACESLARQLGATPAGREMAASIGRAGRQAGTPQEFADLAADNPFADAAYIEATAYDAQGGL